MGDPAVLAGSLNWMGNWNLNAEDPETAIAHHEEALAIFEELGEPRGLASTLDMLGIASVFAGDTAAGVEHYERAISLFRELGDMAGLANSLTGLGHCACWLHTVAMVVPSVAPGQAKRAFEEAARICREIGSPAGESWALWSLGLLSTAQGRYGQALEAAQSSLDIATQIGNHENAVASHTALGILYTEVLAPRRATQHLEGALALAEEVRSSVLICWVRGELAMAYRVLGDWAQAQACLDAVLSAETPMDTIFKRYCWAAQAELTLCRGDPTLALDIVERLITSVPGMSPGHVITFLWRLKSEALTALGRTEDAQALLRAAANNAEATGERSLLWRVHASLGRLYRSTGRLPESSEEFSVARELVQGLADTLPPGQLRGSFIQRAQAEFGPA
jgi:tetratricopeptide (TPR) repeat protein